MLVGRFKGGRRRRGAFRGGGICDGCMGGRVLCLVLDACMRSDLCGCGRRGNGYGSGM